MITICVWQDRESVNYLLRLCCTSFSVSLFFSHSLRRLDALNITEVIKGQGKEFN
jgi:hypothetical protein